MALTERQRGFLRLSGRKITPFLVMMAVVFSLQTFVAGCTCEKQEIPSYPIPRTATKTVAASDATEAWKNQADYVCDGIDDEVEINAALAAAAGGHVMLSEGTFYQAVGANITMPSNTWLSGQGRATVIRPALMDLVSATIWSDSTAGPRVTDLRIDGKIVNIAHGVWFNNVERGEVSNIWVEGGGVNIAIHFSLTTNCRMINNNTHGIGYRALSDCGTNDVVQGNTIYAAAEGINVSGSSYATVNGNTIIEGGDAIIGGMYTSITGNTLQETYSNGILLSGLGCIGNAVQGNVIYGIRNTGVGHHGIYIYGASSDHVISGNEIVQVPGIGAKDSCGIATHEFAGAWPSGITISNNKIASFEYAGIWLYGELTHYSNSFTVIGNKLTGNLYGILATGLQGSIISGNDVYDNRLTGIEIQNASNVLVTGNIARNNGGWGILVETYYAANDRIPMVNNNAVYDNAAGQVTFETYGGTPAHSVWARNIDKARMYDKYLETFMNIQAVSTNCVRADQDLSAALPMVFTIDRQPDVPRGITFSLTHSNITEYTITINGTTASGTAVQETFNQAGGWSGETWNAYATIEAITLVARTGTGEGDICNLGMSARLGLQMPFHTVDDVYKVSKTPVGGSTVDWSGAAKIEAIPAWGVVNVSTGGAIVTGDSFTIWYRVDNNRVN